MIEWQINFPVFFLRRSAFRYGIHVQRERERGREGKNRNWSGFLLLKSISCHFHALYTNGKVPNFKWLKTKTSNTHNISSVHWVLCYRCLLTNGHIDGSLLAANCKRWERATCLIWMNYTKFLYKIYIFISKQTCFDLIDRSEKHVARGGCVVFFSRFSFFCLLVDWSVGQSCR